jgi:hypothetical protein
LTYSLQKPYALTVSRGKPVNAQQGTSQLGEVFHHDFPKPVVGQYLLVQDEYAVLNGSSRPPQQHICTETQQVVKESAKKVL